MAWVLLFFVAGLLEVGWSIGMKYTDGFTTVAECVHRCRDRREHDAAVVRGPDAAHRYRLRRVGGHRRGRGGGARHGGAGGAWSTAARICFIGLLPVAVVGLKATSRSLTPGCDGDAGDRAGVGARAVAVPAARAVGVPAAGPCCRRSRSRRRPLRRRRPWGPARCWGPPWWGCRRRSTGGRSRAPPESPGGVLLPESPGVSVPEPSWSPVEFSSLSSPGLSSLVARFVRGVAGRGRGDVGAVLELEVEVGDRFALEGVAGVLAPISAGAPPPLIRSRPMAPYKGLWAAVLGSWPMTATTVARSGA
ncbi:hypothetical protein STENM327S_07335 [Streptomyces tendae]